jgi:hypothetical protein
MARNDRSMPGKFRRARYARQSHWHQGAYGRVIRGDKASRSSRVGPPASKLLSLSRTIRLRRHRSTATMPSTTAGWSVVPRSTAPRTICPGSARSVEDPDRPPFLHLETPAVVLKNDRARGYPVSAGCLGCPLNGSVARRSSRMAPVPELIGCGRSRSARGRTRLLQCLTSYKCNIY